MSAIFLRHPIAYLGTGVVCVMHELEKSLNKVIKVDVLKISKISKI